MSNAILTEIIWLAKNLLRRIENEAYSIWSIRSSFKTDIKVSLKCYTRVWLRYVYIFAVFDKNESLEDLCDNINGFYPILQFTTEVEKDNNLPI